MQNHGEKPHIKVVWDAETQAVALDFDKAEFKTWNFIIGVLTMGLEAAKVNEQMARMMAMQQQQQQAMMEQQLRGRILKGG